MSAADLFTTTIIELNDATAEALRIFPAQETIGFVTVVRGYAQLAGMNPSNRDYRERLVDAVSKLSEFAMERGGHILARRLLLLADEIRNSSAQLSRSARKVI